MNTYPLELIAQLGPVMFVAGLNQANTTNSIPNLTNPKSNTTNQAKGKKNDSNANTIRRPPPAAAGHRKHQSMSDTMNMNPALTPSSSSSSATSSTSEPSSSSPGPDAQGETPTAAEAEREVQGEKGEEGGEEVDDDGEAEAEMSQPQRGEREKDPFALLASRLREMLLAQRRITVWDPPATGAATGVNGAEEKKIFQVVLVDKDVRFPPRKASLVGNDGDSSMSNAFPSSSSGLSTSSSSSSHTSSHSMSSFPSSSSSSHQLPLLSPLTTSLSSTPHSPLSPLTRTSPVYPDGLIAPIWIRKHTMLVPAVFVLFVRMYEGGGRESELERLEREKDTELARMIGERKKEMSERGIKMTVVLLVSREMLDGSSARLDTRLGYVRRQSGLDSRAALFVLSPIGRDELGEFLKRSSTKRVMGTSQRILHGAF
ncbi:hypothetical protein C8R42DRAFT_107999 [Lentinula raphanica]|nr:hypothetical protein C8R42DRAFT_107999 [Lentinula raphanica]